jgi:hypothetical protein
MTDPDNRRDISFADAIKRYLPDKTRNYGLVN